MKPRTRLSTKGQVVIPESVRRAHHWKAGTEFVIEEEADGIRLSPVHATTAASWEALIGCTGYRGPRLSLVEMDEAVAREASRHK